MLFEKILQIEILEICHKRYTTKNSLILLISTWLFLNKSINYAIASYSSFLYVKYEILIIYLDNL